MSSQEEAQRYKTLGNEKFKSNEFATAIEHFTKAIDLTNDNQLKLLCYSNRSACYLKLQKFEDALQDARYCKILDSR